ncbi:MAG: prepilin-type N-terminal cleavage/methylation domain-containing protein [Elusimicrobiaceae bacterium]|nr:prepilin-type N-terminal cleavage/methylation domain-containing protein [Elusimicrobiaceae bacterium]
MINNKGFTLTEVLLAAMIVGIIGIALAALTTAALREDSVGRTRLMLRNQASLFLRQLRQDVKEAKTVNVSGNGKTLTLTKQELYPEMLTDSIVYTYDSTNYKRGNEVVLNNVKDYANVVGIPNEWKTPFSLTDNESVLQVRLVVGIDDPPVKEAIKATFVLPYEKVE